MIIIRNRCIVQNCSKGDGIHDHCLLKDLEQGKRWIAVIKNSSVVELPYEVLHKKYDMCHKHFHQDTHLELNSSKKNA